MKEKYSENDELEFVFNNDLLKESYSDIKYIIVGDNPGKNEFDQSRYLVKADTNRSSAGNNFRRLFKYLDIDIDNEVLILNKIPIYTNKTEDLKKLYSNYEDILIKSQKLMAELTFDLHKIIKCELYITGLSGCYNKQYGWLKKSKDNKYYKCEITPYYFEKLRNLYDINISGIKSKVYILKHFSYWCIFDDFCIKNGRIEKIEKLTIKKIEDEKIDKTKILNAFKKLDYAQKLISSCPK